jgi:Domain of unknown function (DUF4365)
MVGQGKELRVCRCEHVNSQCGKLRISRDLPKRGGKNRGEYAPTQSCEQVAMSKDSVLSESDRKEALSLAYIHAISAAAGYTVATRNFDRDGIDLVIDAGGEMRPAIGIQAKATVNLGQSTAGMYRFPLKRRNYDLLRITTQVPRILVVMAMPREEADWLTMSPVELVLRHCAFWVSLCGAAETDNAESVTVFVPERNLFDIETLRGLMEQSRNGVIR